MLIINNLVKVGLMLESLPRVYIIIQMKDTYRRDEVALHSVWMQHGDLFFNGPTQTFCRQKYSHSLSKLLRHHCTMFQNFLSLNEKPYNFSLSDCIADTYDLSYSRRPSAESS